MQAPDVSEPGCVPRLGGSYVEDVEGVAPTSRDNGGRVGGHSGPTSHAGFRGLPRGDPVTPANLHTHSVQAIIPVGA